MSIKQSSGTKTALAMLATIAVAVAVREISVWLCTWFGMPTAANIVGLLGLFALLIVVRLTVGLPAWLSVSANKLLAESGFAFLPVSAGAGILLFGLGADLPKVAMVIVLSTLLPLWLVARLAASWLSVESNTGGRADDA